MILTACLEGRKDAKGQQDESYLSTGDLPALNTSCHTGFAPDTYRVPDSHVGTGLAPDSHVSTGVRSVSRPCNVTGLEGEGGKQSPTEAM